LAVPATAAPAPPTRGFGATPTKTSALNQQAVAPDMVAPLALLRQAVEAEEAAAARTGPPVGFAFAQEASTTRVRRFPVAAPPQKVSDDLAALQAAHAQAVATAVPATASPTQAAAAFAATFCMSCGRRCPYAICRAQS
jgi:hypothetical protein